MNLGRIPLLVWFLVPTVILIGLGVWFFTKSSTDGMQEGTDLNLVPVSTPVEGTVEFKVEGRNHIPTGTQVTNYNSNPPNSGDHWAGPAKNGVYDSELLDEQLIHNLEHGHVWISYKPDVGDEVKNELKKIVEEDNWKIVLEPRDKNDTPIALVAWGRVLKMDTPDYDKVRAFIKTYRNRGPERTPE